MTASLSAKELAERLGLSKARISQYVSEGKLAGCYTGEGRARRFDLACVAAALGQRLDLGQMMGNGAVTRRAIRTAADPAMPASPPVSAPPRPSPVPAETPAPDRYEEARIQSAEQDARRKTRDNERDEGRWVLAEEVQRQSAKFIGQEIAKFESALREGARDVADHFGVDYREARQILLRKWREHRGARSAELSKTADASEMSEAEQEANV